MKRGLLVIPVVALMTVAGCASSPSHESLTRSAARLEQNADALSRGDHDRGAYASTSYAREADELAQRAHDFRRTIEDSRADRRDVDESFESLSHSYHSLRDDVDHADSREAQLDLKPVTEAYLDVERGMGGYRVADRDRDHRDRDRY
jgi:hypothetical protein